MDKLELNSHRVLLHRSTPARKRSLMGCPPGRFAAHGFMARLHNLRLRLSTLDTRRVETLQGDPDSWRADRGQSSTARGYGYRWQQERAAYLRLHPLCVMCEQETPRRITVATVVDHRIPHRGDQALFWDRTNWQALCKTHHDAKTQHERQATPGA